MCAHVPVMPTVHVCACMSPVCMCSRQCSLYARAVSGVGTLYSTRWCAVLPSLCSTSRCVVLVLLAGMECDCTCTVASVAAITASYRRR